MFEEKYSRDQKIWACKTHQNKEASLTEIAKSLGCSYNAIRNYISEWSREFKVLGEEKAFLPRKSSSEYSTSEKIAFVKDFLSQELDRIEYPLQHGIAPSQFKYWLSKFRRRVQIQQDCIHLRQTIELCSGESSQSVETSIRSSESVNEKPFKTKAPDNENASLSKETVFEHPSVSSEDGNETDSYSGGQVFENRPFSKGPAFESQPKTSEASVENSSGSRDRGFKNFKRSGAPFFENQTLSRKLKFKRGPLSQNQACETSSGFYVPKHKITTSPSGLAMPEALITSLYASSGDSAPPLASDIPAYNRDRKEALNMARNYYPQEMKDEAAARFCAGETVAQIARSLNVGYHTVNYWVKKYQKENGIVINPKSPPAAPGFPVPEEALSASPLGKEMCQLKEQMKVIESQLNKALSDLAASEERNRQKDKLIAAQKKTFHYLQRSLVLSQFKDEPS